MKMGGSISPAAVGVNRLYRALCCVAMHASTGWISPLLKSPVIFTRQMWLCWRGCGLVAAKLRLCAWDKGSRILYADVFPSNRYAWNVSAFPEAPFQLAKLTACLHAENTARHNLRICSKHSPMCQQFPENMYHNRGNIPLHEHTHALTHILAINSWAGGRNIAVLGNKGFSQVSFEHFSRGS